MKTKKNTIKGVKKKKIIEKDIGFIISKSGRKKPKVSFYSHKAGRGGWSEWVYPKMENNYLFKCCDCGLVHEMQFASIIAINKKGIHFNVVKLPKEIRVSFRARRMKIPKELKGVIIHTPIKVDKNRVGK